MERLPFYVFYCKKTHDRREKIDQKRTLRGEYLPGPKLKVQKIKEVMKTFGEWHKDRERCHRNRGNGCHDLTTYIHKHLLKV